MASFGFLLMRGLFGAAAHVAPGLAGRAAFELFRRTPDPKRVSAREATLIAAAAPFMETARHHRLRVGAGWVCAYEFRPEGGERRPTALVVHGWGGRAAHMRGVVAALLDAGMRVVALDLPGHGASSGRRLDMVLAVRSLAAAAEWFGPFAAIVGHSFGGAVAVNALVGSIDGVARVATDRLVLIAAPSSIPAIFDDFAGFLGLGARAQVALADRVARIAGRPLGEFVGAVQLSAQQVPTLVVHAPDDKEVPFEDARRYEAAGRHVELLRAPGRGHRRILADAEIGRAVSAFAALGRTAAVAA